MEGKGEQTEGRRVRNETVYEAEIMSMLMKTVKVEKDAGRREVFIRIWSSGGGVIDGNDTCGN